MCVCVCVCVFVGSFCMDEERQGGKTHLSLKALVDNNQPKAKDLKMIEARA